MSVLESPSVRRVRDALLAAGSEARVIALQDTARSAEDAAQAVGVELGAIVKTLVFRVGDQAVLALVSGDRRCREKSLPGVLGLSGKVRRADAEMVREVTGFAIGGVPPVAHPAELPTAIDTELSRFPTIWAAAGHPYCVFETTVAELERLTGGVLSADIGISP